MLNYNPPKIRVWNPHPGLHDFHQDNSRCKTIRENHDPILKTFLNSLFLEYLVIQFVTFEMVKWPFQGVKWPPTRGSKGHFESPGTCYFLFFGKLEDTFHLPKGCQKKMVRNLLSIHHLVFRVVKHWHPLKLGKGVGTDHLWIMTIPQESVRPLPENRPQVIGL